MRNYPVDKNQTSLLVATETAGSSLWRWLQVVPLAILVTCCLFIFMERLIAMADVAIDESETIIIEDIYWEEPIIETIKENPVKKQEPVERAPNRPTETERIEEQVEISIPGEGFKLEPVTGVNFAMGFNVPIAQYLGAAKYPANALRRGIEGYVDVRFDVTEYGGTDNIEVLHADPLGVFEKAAVRAVERWRYQPKTHEEKPVRFEGMMQRVRFEMQK